jgi:HAD superfamily hydrolase (TIGR01549 family)
VAFQAVVFDLFDTLVDLYMEKLPRVEFDGRVVPSSAVAMHEALPAAAEIDFGSFVGALAEVDREFRASRYAQHLELPTFERFSVFCERLGLAERIGDEASEVPARLTDIHMGMLRECSGAPSHHGEVLSALHERARIGLCSNFSHTPTALAILEQYGLLSHFDCLVVSDDLGFRKPRGEIFEAVLAELGVDPADALHVGDNLRADVEGGAAHGMATAWITRRVPQPEAKLREYDGPAPDFQISDLGELQGLLEDAPGSE